MSSYIWPLSNKREQISMNIWQLLKEQNFLLSPCMQHKNPSYLMPLYPSIATHSHLLRILILKLWLPGCHWSGKADGKTIFYKMHKHLENHYKKWTGKKRENENMMNSLNKREKKFRYQAMLQRFLNH
jgi:hypothetical protein